MLYIPLIYSALYYSVNYFTTGYRTDIDASSFAKEIMSWAKYGQESESFVDMIQSLRMPTELQNVDFKTLAAGPFIPICTICTAVMDTFISLRRKGESEESIREKVIKLCVRLNIEEEAVCTGFIESNLPIILYVVDARPNLKASTVCGVVLESDSCPLDDPEFDWSIDISNSINTMIIENETQEQIKVLHLTDFHYEPSSDTSIESKRKKRGVIPTNITLATEITMEFDFHLNCDCDFYDDISYATIDVINHTKVAHQDIEFVYITGDLIGNGTWEPNESLREETNIVKLESMYNNIREVFNNTKVYPIIGHQTPTVPNQFAPRHIRQVGLSTTWLYESLAHKWYMYNWLPYHAYFTIAKGGYYTVTPRKGFRIIALNSNVCLSYNWWILYIPKDPDGQLQWLADVLSEAEKNNEFVHILSHIPANSKSCFSTWRREYLRIIDRFSHIIKAEFNGHTHKDEIAIFYNSDSRATNVAWNGGSIKHYAQSYPNYKVYTVNLSNYTVADYENWIYNLSAAKNHDGTIPTWYKSYSFKEEYDLPDLSTNSLNNWQNRVLNNNTLLDRYYRNFYKLTEPWEDICDTDCKKKFIYRTSVRTIPFNISNRCELWLGLILLCTIGQYINTF